MRTFYLSFTAMHSGTIFQHLCPSGYVGDEWAFTPAIPHPPPPVSTWFTCTRVVSFASCCSLLGYRWLISAGTMSRTSATGNTIKTSWRRRTVKCILRWACILNCLLLFLYARGIGTLQIWIKRHCSCVVFYILHPVVPYMYTLRTSKVP